MKWEYIATGLALLGIGVTLSVALPPPWWSKMPPVFVQIGLLFGLFLSIVGSLILFIGVWPNIKIMPVLLMVSGIILFVTGAIWYWNSDKNKQSEITKNNNMATDEKPIYSMNNITNNQGIITQGQTGGTNTINIHKSLERHITPEQSKQFLAVAPHGNERKIGVRIQDGSNEGRIYTHEIMQLFQNAGWVVIFSDAANTLPENYRGLVIETSEPYPSLVTEIAQSFKQAGIQFQLMKGPWPNGADAYRIVIWPIP